MKIIFQYIEQNVSDLKYLLDVIDQEPVNLQVRKIAERKINQIQGDLAKLLEEVNGEAAEQPVNGTAVAVSVVKTVEDVSTATVLGEQMSPAFELRDLLTLNDTFRFSRELFDGNVAQMNAILEELGRQHSVEEANELLLSTGIDPENEAYPDLADIIEKYFSK